MSASSPSSSSPSSSSSTTPLNVLGLRPPPYSIYRACTLGQSLSEACKRRVADKDLDAVHIPQILGLFDTAVTDALATQVNHKVTLSGHLDVYRHCDNIWTFIIRHARIQDPTQQLLIDAIKVVAPEHRKEKRPMITSSILASNKKNKQQHNQDNKEAVVEAGYESDLGNTHDFPADDDD